MSMLLVLMLVSVSAVVVGVVVLPLEKIKIVITRHKTRQAAITSVLQQMKMLTCSKSVSQGGGITVQCFMVCVRTRAVFPWRAVKS